MADDLVHFALASDGPWPNWAICAPAQNRHHVSRYATLTGKPSDVTCSRCLDAMAEAAEAVLQRGIHASA